MRTLAHGLGFGSPSNDLCDVTKIFEPDWFKLFRTGQLIMGLHHAEAWAALNATASWSLILKFVAIGIYASSSKWN